MKIHFVGHLSHDLLEKGKYSLGGSVYFAARLAHHWGLECSLLSSYGEDFIFKNDIDLTFKSITTIPSTLTTCFENIYSHGHRVQILHAQAAPLRQESDLSLKAGILFLAPLFKEVDTRIIKRSKTILKVATIQGWLRETDEQNRILPKAMDWKKLEGLDIAFVSEEDIEGLNNALVQVRKYVPLVVLTQGEKGITVFENQNTYHYPAFPVQVHNPTGAGDSLAMGFCYSYYKERDIRKAAKWGQAAAALSISNREILPSKLAIKHFLEDKSAI